MLDYHPIAGFFTFILAIFLVIGGMIGLFKRKHLDHDWESKSMLRYGKCHAIFGYFVILISQVTITIGIYIYWN